MDLSILLSAREGPVLKHTRACNNTYKHTKSHTEPSSSCRSDKHALSDTRGLGYMFKEGRNKLADRITVYSEEQRVCLCVCICMGERREVSAGISF